MTAIISSQRLSSSAGSWVHTQLLSPPRVELTRYGRIGEPTSTACQLQRIEMPSDFTLRSKDYSSWSISGNSWDTATDWGLLVATYGGHLPGSCLETLEMWWAFSLVSFLYCSHFCEDFTTTKPLSRHLCAYTISSFISKLYIAVICPCKLHYNAWVLMIFLTYQVQ